MRLQTLTKTSLPKNCYLMRRIKPLSHNTPQCHHLIHLSSSSSSSPSLRISRSPLRRIARSRSLPLHAPLTRPSAFERPLRAAPKALWSSATGHVAWSLLARAELRCLAARSMFGGLQSLHSSCFVPESSETPSRITCSRPQAPTPLPSMPAPDSARRTPSRAL